MTNHASHYGKGAIQTPKALASTRFRLVAPLTAPIIDWNTPYNVENGFTLPQLDQKSSSSCTAQATAYYGMALMAKTGNDLEEYSRKHIYSQIYIPPEGGAYIWKAMSIPVKQGYVSAKSVPDGDSTEITMRDTSLNGNAIQEALALKYAQITRINIDQLADIMEKNSGFVTGFNGRNDMFSSDGTANILSGPSEWGHAEWMCGHLLRDHRDQNGNLLHPNEKTLKSKNSWSALWGDNGYGYFPECFVNSGMFFDAYVYANITDIDPMSMRRLVKSNEPGSKDVYWIRELNNPDGSVQKFKDQFINSNAFTILDGRWNSIESVPQSELDAIPDGVVLIVVPQE